MNAFNVNAGNKVRSFDHDEQIPLSPNMRRHWHPMPGSAVTRGVKIRFGIALLNNKGGTVALRVSYSNLAGLEMQAPAQSRGRRMGDQGQARAARMEAWN